MGRRVTLNPYVPGDGVLRWVNGVFCCSRSEDVHVDLIGYFLGVKHASIGSAVYPLTIGSRRSCTSAWRSQCSYRSGLYRSLERTCRWLVRMTSIARGKVSIDSFAGVLLLVTGLLYFIKTFKYTTNSPEDNKEDDRLFASSLAFPRTSISTQTSVMDDMQKSPPKGALTVEPHEMISKH